MLKNPDQESLMDHCRIGSLEISCHEAETALSDHCRIGSLETGNGEISQL